MAEAEGHHREPMCREAKTRLHPLLAVGKIRPKAVEGHDPSRGPTPGGRKAQVYGRRTWILDKVGPTKVEALSHLFPAPLSV